MHLWCVWLAQHSSSLIGLHWISSVILVESLQV